MSISLELGTPLAAALSNVVQPKLVEIEWSTGSDSTLAEYIILMLVNGKTQEQIAAELSNDLLNLPPEDSSAKDFAKWLWDQVDILNRQINGHVPSQNQTTAQQPAVQAIPSYTGNDNERRRSSKQSSGSASQDAEMADVDGVQNGSIPTGPKSMRNGAKPANKRLIGQLSKAMDRSNDAVLHRVQGHKGTERIGGLQSRQPPTGPRANLMKAQGVHKPIPTGPGNAAHMNRPPVQISPQQQMHLLAMYEQQTQMMAAILGPQMAGMTMPAPAINPAFLNGMPPQPPQPGRSLFDRVENNPRRSNNNFNNKGANHHVNGNHTPAKPSQDIEMEVSDNPTSSMEVEPSQPTDPSETTCKFNLSCTNPTCPFAHQSPAAPPGTTIDFQDTCSFGAACMNRKCVGRHPSPAQRKVHQSEQDCKYDGFCSNPDCIYKHSKGKALPNGHHSSTYPPATHKMPLCRFGDKCTREGCMFTHLKQKCKFHPCKNPVCPYQHDEGQRAVFEDKKWEKEGHVSERKFVVGEHEEEEVILPGAGKVEEEAIKTGPVAT